MSNKVHIMIPSIYILPKYDEDGNVVNTPYLKDKSLDTWNNIMKRGWISEDNQGYVHAERQERKKIQKPHPKRNTYSPKPEKDLIVQEMVEIMESYVYTDPETGLVMFPEVFNFFPSIAVNEGNINNPVPDTLPNSARPAQYDNTDPENAIETEPERLYTWDEYLQPTKNYIPSLIEGVYYYASSGLWSRLIPVDEEVRGELLMMIYNSADATLVDGVPVIEES